MWRIEFLFWKRARKKIFTEENIRKLLGHINDEARVFDDEYQQKIDELNALLTEKLTRRAKLFEGIETGAFDLKDITSRLKDLNDEIASLESQKAELIKKHNTGNGFLVTEKELRPFVEDLHQTLSEGSIIQRRGFIRSFIKRIEVDYPQAVIEYNMPIPTKIKDRTSTDEVLSLVQFGVADRIWTGDHKIHNLVL